jgi:hypothetical protein
MRQFPAIEQITREFLVSPNLRYLLRAGAKPLAVGLALLLALWLGVWLTPSTAHAETRALAGPERA